MESSPTTSQLKWSKEQLPDEDGWILTRWQVGRGYEYEAIYYTVAEPFVTVLGPNYHLDAWLPIE